MTKRKYKYWTQKEISFLKENYTLKNKELARKLNRTIGTVTRRKSQLRLTHFNKWSKEKVLVELKKENRRLKHSPSTREVPQMLYQATLRLFGSFNNAKKVARLKINIPKHHKITKNIKKLTKKLAYILGVEKGDGYCYIKKTKAPARTNAIIGLKVKDKDFALTFKHFLERWSGIKTKFYILEKGFYQVTLYSIDCAKVIKNFDVHHILTSNKQTKSCFLKGLYDSEGGVIGKNLENRQKAKRWIHFSNSDIEIIKMVNKLLKILKIQHKIRSRIHSGFGSKRIQYEILIHGRKNLEKFHKEIGFSIKRKQERLLNVLSSFNKS